MNRGRRGWKLLRCNQRRGAEADGRALPATNGNLLRFGHGLAFANDLDLQRVAEFLAIGQIRGLERTAGRGRLGLVVVDHQLGILRQIDDDGRRSGDLAAANLAATRAGAAGAAGTARTVATRTVHVAATVAAAAAVGNVAAAAATTAAI